MIASAILYLLLYYSHSSNIKGDSYRLNDKLKVGVWTQASRKPSSSGKVYP